MPKKNELKNIKINDEINNKNYAYGLLQITESSSITHMQIYNKTSLTRLQNPLKAAFLPSSIICLLAFAAW